MDLSVYTIPIDTPVVVLDAKQAFDNLTPKEKQYALALSRADWEGAKICLLQCSPESPMIFSLLQYAFSSNGVVQDVCDKAKEQGELSETEIQQALIYCAAFYGNMGNYKSFGDTKFIPQVAPEKLYQFLSSGRGSDDTKLKELWDQCKDRMYSLSPRHCQLGLGQANGISTYFSSNCNEDDANVAAKFMNSIKLSPYNTRLFKSSDEKTYTILLASSLESNDKEDDDIAKLCQKESYEWKEEDGTTYTFKIRRGDYAPLMKRVVDHLTEALPHTANDFQTNMIQSYIASFSLGSIEQHKTASRYWIQDRGPVIESYIGFIESYRDPSGVRGEWEGFVACVNKEVSRKFNLLVEKAPEMLKLMPWDTMFEKDTFLRPDFTSLEVLSFGSSGVPAGINIPNYDDIRQHEGFKNVSLGNVLQASYNVSGDKPVTFVAPQDQELFKKLKGEAFEVQVGIHELLGHGSGKLYHADTDDTKTTFLNGNGPVQHPILNEPIKGPFYAPGSTWDSTFGKIASTYEECRAECSGIFLCLEPTVLEVFGHSAAANNGDVHDIMYVNWLSMVRAGLLGLEFYAPETKEWKQAHMCARYVILRVLLEGSGVILNGDKKGEEKTEDDAPLVKIQMTENAEDKQPDVVIELNRAKIATDGKDIIGKFLMSLQVYKSLGDVTNGTAMYQKYSHVTEEMLKLRKIVMARKEPRKLLIQPHLFAKGEDVEYQTFPATPAGMIESFAARYPSEDEELLKLYQSDAEHVTD